MTEMSKAEVARFLMQGTFTGKLATVKSDGSPHVVPIWFVVENDKGRGKAANIILTTGDTSVDSMDTSVPLWPLFFSFCAVLSSFSCGSVFII